MFLLNHTVSLWIIHLLLARHFLEKNVENAPPFFPHSHIAIYPTPWLITYLLTPLLITGLQCDCGTWVLAVSVLVFDILIAACIFICRSTEDTPLSSWFAFLLWTSFLHISACGPFHLPPNLQSSSEPSRPY